MAKKKNEKEELVEKDKKKKNIMKPLKTISKKTKKKASDKKDEIEVLELDGASDTSKKKSRPKKKNKKKKYTHVFGPVEFSFNFISLVVIICVGLYFGGRSFYYYSLQSKNSKETAQTLNGLVLLNNKLMKDSEDGLHQDEDGYFFKGNVGNNYVWFANRMFRVMRVNDDNSVKLVSDDLVASFMWGESAEYDNSNLRWWLTTIENEPVSGIYYHTIPSQKRFLTKTQYTIDHLKDNKVESGKEKKEDFVTSISLDDYIEAGGKSSYLNNGKLYFIIGYNEDEDNLYIEEDGSIMGCSPYDGYGVRSVITLNKNIPVSQGDGSKDNPYFVEQGDDKNYVDSYVKLGDDVWKVFDDRDGKLKMYLNGYITVDGNEVIRNYSSYSSRLDYFAGDNIGSYLYNDYFNSLPYKDSLINNTYPYGELSDEVGYYFKNVYNSVYEGKVGLLNIFDYVSNNDLSDYFRDNTGASMATSQYAVLSNGLLEEAEVTDSKHIVPVISIQSSSIKSGNGRIDNPYIVG